MMNLEYIRLLEDTGELPADNATAALVEAEEEHHYDAFSTLLLNITLIGCLLLAYYVKKFKIYHLPESAGALLVGVVVGGVARLSTDKLQLFEFVSLLVVCRVSPLLLINLLTHFPQSPEVFFFVLLPPIIFEAGYSLKKKDFFDNIGAITMFAMVGTIISTFVVGGLSFYAAQAGIINNIDKKNPMEALLFGALISAVDPVATLSIMGSAELGCDPLLYSLVFGESVLNDAIAISLFNVFAKYYDPDGPDFTGSQIPAALLTFLMVSGLSVVVGISLGLTASFLYKHTSLVDYPHLETSILFSFCYLCYSTAEAVGLSGIMALFFQGIVLSHYNSYNLSHTAHVASEQIFATLATIAETAVFLYMGMGVFTGRFQNFDVVFTVLALSLCLLGRFLNIFPLSWIANRCRTASNKIPMKMQCVLWFAGLRGAIAFALAMNMPGNHREVYATATLSICIFTTVVCGGLTNKVLEHFGMKKSNSNRDVEDEMSLKRSPSSPTATVSPTSSFRPDYSLSRKKMYKGAKRIWKQFDNDFLKPNFGGATAVASAVDDDQLGNYELGVQYIDSDDEDDGDGSDKENDGVHT